MVPKVNNSGNHSFFYTGIMAWNGLPTATQLASSSGVFCVVSAFCLVVLCVTPRTMLEISVILLHGILLDYLFMCFFLTRNQSINQSKLTWVLKKDDQIKRNELCAEFVLYSAQ